MAEFSDIVNSGYCYPNSINLRIDMEKGVTYNNDNNQVIFHMEKHFSHHHRRVLQDASSKPICIQHKKKGTMHGRWEVYNDKSELLFIVRRPSKIKREENIVLDVFLAKNIEESVCKVKASGRTKSCEIYAGQSTLASSHMENNGAMRVDVKGNVDHAFIVALLLIVDEKMIRKFKKICKGTVNAISGVLSVVGLGLGIAELTDDLQRDDSQENDSQK